MSPKVVWKFALPIRDRFKVDLPRESEPIAVMTQNGVPHLWALVDPSLAPEPRHFRMAGTGHDISEQIVCHVGSFHLAVAGGDLVFHVFEIEP